ncbi:MAG TPA: hypothetical protein VKR58_03800 [Aquella sp.]|nr:hypothetical protein [Aquella sp.]
MNHKYIYHIFVLHEHMKNMIGIHYPREIIPLIIMTSYNPIKISCGFNHTTLISDKAYAWGYNGSGRLGFGDDGGSVKFPKEIILHENIKEIICGGYHTMILTVFNKIYVCGENNFGQLGLDHNNRINHPQEMILNGVLPSKKDTISISCGMNHTIAMIKNKQLYGWGANTFGELGLGHDNDCYLPQEINLCGERDIISVKCGYYHTVVLVKSKFNRSNKCYAWGMNESGELGLGYVNLYKNTPQELNLLDIVTINCGHGYTMALMQNPNKIYVWGRNDFGQLGLGDTTNRNSPTELSLSNLKFMAISCGMNHVIALTHTGKLFVWGNNKDGQLGLGNQTNYYTPQELIFPEPIISIFSGGYHNIMISVHNKIFVWGDNNLSQLGLGDKLDRLSPTEIVVC